MTIDEFIEKINVASSKIERSNIVINDLSQTERKVIFEGLDSNQRLNIMNSLTVRAQNKLFTAADISYRNSYLNSLGDENTIREFRNAIRDYAVEEFWTNEVELVKQGKGTYNWNVNNNRIF